MEEGSRCQIKIDRPVYEHDQLRKDFDYDKSRTDKCSTCLNYETNFKKLLLRTVPVVGWLRHYKWKNDIVADIVAGFTVAIMHIPQGMAYGLLGNVPPVVGIYMAFFPVLIYFFLGTSRHNSMGTFAVVCLMTGKAVLEHSDPSFFSKRIEPNATDQNPIIESVHDLYSPIEVATAVTFTVALFQLAMYVLRLGVVSALLSETLVSGFTTGAAFHVIVSQIKDLLGLHIPRHKGLFVVINVRRTRWTITILFFAVADGTERCARVVDGKLGGGSYFGRHERRFNFKQRTVEAGCCQEIVVPSANRIDCDCRRDFSFQILRPRRDLLY
jgi:solute carrier family 26 protein